VAVATEQRHRSAHVLSRSLSLNQRLLSRVFAFPAPVLLLSRHTTSSMRTHDRAPGNRWTIRGDSWWRWPQTQSGYGRQVIPTASTWDEGCTCRTARRD
jgi:hypothetical protein